MKTLRYLKLRTLCKTPADLATGFYNNPLKRMVPVDLTAESRTKLLHQFKEPLSTPNLSREPSATFHFLFAPQESLILCSRILHDKNPPAWLAWDRSISLYMPPDETKSTFAPWDESSQDAIDILRQVTNSASFWESLSTYYSEENHETFIIQDNVSCVKSICKHISRKC